MTEWILGLLVLALIAWGIVIYNHLVRDRQRVLAGWSDIGVQLKRRHDLIPKLVDAVAQYASYEQSTLADVTGLRAKAADIGSAAAQSSTEGSISRGLGAIYALVEDYPELRANESFLQLQGEISTVENDIQFARRYYNGAVRNLNTRIDSFPDLLLARLFNYTSAEYFEFEGSQSK